jgi:hypothetical protein
MKHPACTEHGGEKTREGVKSGFPTLFFFCFVYHLRTEDNNPRTELIPRSPSFLTYVHRRISFLTHVHRFIGTDASVIAQPNLTWDDYVRETDVFKCV